MPTDSTTITYKTASGAMSQANMDETGSARLTSSPTVPASTTNQHLAISVDVSQLISFLIVSSRDLTLKTNSSSSPAQTFSLKAGQGFTWNQDNGTVNPLTVDITDLYFTNAGTVPAAVQMSFLAT